MGVKTIEPELSGYVRTDVDCFLKTTIDLNASKRSALWMALSLVVIAITNFPILSAFFFADDFLHFYQIANWRPLEFILSSHGGHLYIFRNAVFYGMYKLFGMYATPYFVTVLISHLACCILLFKALQLITGKPMTAAAGTMLWGTSYLLHATMGWYSVYGHVLASLFFLLFFYDVIRIDKDTLPFSTWIAFRWSVYIVLMATSFGNGLAAACLVPIVAGLILWRQKKKWHIVASLIPAVLLVIVLYITKDAMFAMVGGIGAQPGPPPVGDVLLYARPMVEMVARMGAYSIYPLYVIATLFGFPNVAFFLSFPIGLLFLYLLFRSKTFRQYYLAIAMLLAGVIAVTAYGRTSFYLIFSVPIHAAAITPRYYYLSMMLTVILLTLMANDLLRSHHRAERILMRMVVVGLVLLTPVHYLIVRNLVNDDLFTSQKRIYNEAAQSIERAIQATPNGKHVYIDNTMPEPLLLFMPSETDFPGMAAVFAITYPKNTVEGRRIFFVEPDDYVVQRNVAHKHWRISSLMVSASDLDEHAP